MKQWEYRNVAAILRAVANEVAHNPLLIHAIERAANKGSSDPVYLKELAGKLEALVDNGSAE